MEPYHITCEHREFSAFTSLLANDWEYTLTIETQGFHQLTSTSQHMLAVEKIFHKILKNTF
jgi:hypothetical protein